MKRLLTFFLAALSLPLFPAFAQNNVQDVAAAAAAAVQAAETVQDAPAKANYWTRSIKFDFGITNTSLSNWAAGGTDQLAISTGYDGNANYKKGLMFWNNRLQMDFGFFATSDKPVIQKSKDRFYLDSKWGYKASEKSKVAFSAMFNFRTQFTATYKFVTPSGENPGYDEWMAVAQLKSGFLSPAYTDLSIGLDWEPWKWLSINASPLTGGFTIVRTPELRNSYSMPLKPEYEDYEGIITPDMYRAGRFELGAKIATNIKVTINERLSGETQFTVFSDYLSQFQTRVNWDAKVVWKLTKHFAFTFQSWLIYDPKVLIDGTQKVQFKEYLTLNYTHTFTPRSRTARQKASK